MTFSVVACVPAAGLLAVATASRSLGVGNAVPAVWPGVGAVVSQSWTNRALRGRTLAEVAAGRAAGDALAVVLSTDPGRELRQLAVVDLGGGVAVHTGAECSPWAGSRRIRGEADGAVGVVCGNLLVGEETLAAVVATIGRVRTGDPLDLARAMVAALRAGQRAGGDVRGQQSAALQVASGPPQPWHPPDLDVDLRVDDHPEPLAELDRLLAQVTPRSA